MSFNSSRWIKSTRTRHHCWWCNEVIPVGSAAKYVAGKWQGDFNDCHAHPECQAAFDSLPYDELTEGWLPGDHARGRTDDEHRQPPQFSPDYRGRKEQA